MGQIAIRGQDRSENRMKIKDHYALSDFKKAVLTVPHQHLPWHKINKTTDYQKGTETLKQKLDSTIGEGWNEFTNQWVNSRRDEFEYDDKGNNTLFVISGWDESTNQWVGYWKIEMDFDNSGNYIQQVDYLWDEITSQWIYFWEIQLTYDVNGNIVLSEFYIWDETTNQWLINAKDDYTYDENGYLITSIYLYWDETTSQWINNEKTEYEYDNSGNEIIYTLYIWDEVNNLWFIAGKTENTYDSYGNLTMEVNFSWDNNQWEKQWGNEYIFNTSNQLILEKSLIWNGSAWFNPNKSEYNYDSHENLILETYYEWNDLIYEFELADKQEFTYNNTYEYDELVLPWIYSMFDINILDILFNHMLTGSFGYEFIEGEWVDSNRETFYYSEIEINDIMDHQFPISNIFPNPSSGKTSIFYNLSAKSNVKLSILNLNGQLITTLVNEKQTQGDHKVNFDATDLPAGIYFCVLKTNEGMQTKKIIKL